MDMQMPEIDGLEATRRLRAELPEARQPYVIAMTANAMQDDRDLCLAAGMNDYVSKPVRVSELIAALSRGRPLRASEGAPAVHRSYAAETREGTAQRVGAVQASSVDAPGDGTDEVLDPKALRELLNALGGQSGLLIELVNTFLEDAPKLLGELLVSLDQGDAAGVHRIAHSLKANALDFGAAAFAQGCKELEALAKTGSLEGARELHARIIADYARVEAALLRLQAAGALVGENQ
jgi:HPt (histidine-containing phosphotransfer) domain-containing protein